MKKLNPFHQCIEYGISLKKCPSFIFFLMGVVIIISDLLTYFVGLKYISNPLLVSFIVTIITMILFILSYFINRSFEELLEINMMKTEFINIISHQIRTPLSSMRWTLDLIRSGKINVQDSKFQSYIDLLSSDTRSMERLVENFLMVARMERGKALLGEEKISIVDLIKKILADFEPVFTARNITVDLETEDVPEIFTDRKKVRIAIENLIDNAIKYSGEKGKIEIIVRKKGRDKIYVGVRDFGLGIPKKDQKYIFQKFYRLKSARLAHVSGTGLGLYITKLIIEKLGGKVGFSSQENKGSLFWFTLPIKEK